MGASDSVLLRSPWPGPVPDGYGRAFDFHLGALAGWLLRAGAEPRVALVLCSGPAARDRFVAGIGMDGVEVELAPASIERPVHSKIAEHQGDHFNRTLYVVDGLKPDRALFEALDGRAGLLARTATWVALVIESLDALAALYAHAPRLAAKVMRRCLVIDGHAAEAKSAPLDAHLRERWRDGGRLAEQIYHHAMTPSHAPALLDFDRLARTGYLPALVGRVMHPERQRLAALWSAGPDARALPFTAEQAGPAAAEAALRRATAALDGDLRGRLHARLDDRARLGAGETPVDRALADLKAVRALAEGEAADPKAVDRCRETVDAGRYDPSLTAHAHQALAMAAAAEGDLEDCVRRLRTAGEAAANAGLPELLFDVLEKQMQIEVFSEQRGAAKSLLERLEALAPVMHAPFFAARARLARGEYAGPLDPARATTELAEAERLFRAHGYPTWAATAREAMP